MFSVMSEKLLRYLARKNRTEISGLAIMDNNIANLSFNIYNANGGKIVECRSYHACTSETMLYIIADGDNFEEELGKIITSVLLRG